MGNHPQDAVHPRQAANTDRTVADRVSRQYSLIVCQYESDGYERPMTPPLTGRGPVAPRFLILIQTPVHAALRSRGAIYPIRFRAARMNPTSATNRCARAMIFGCYRAFCAGIIPDVSRSGRVAPSGACESLAVRTPCRATAAASPICCPRRIARSRRRRRSSRRFPARCRVRATGRRAASRYR